MNIKYENSTWGLDCGRVCGIALFWASNAALFKFWRCWTAAWKRKHKSLTVLLLVEVM